MALDRSDHKRIALSIAKELHRVLSDANGARIHARHKARIAPAAPVTEPPDDPEMDDMLSSMDSEDPMHERSEAPDFEAEEHAKAKGKRPFPPRRR